MTSVQIFSKSVAASLTYLKQTNPDFKDCQATIDFTTYMNDLFDVLNRSKPRDGLKILKNKKLSSHFQVCFFCCIQSLNYKSYKQVCLFIPDFRR